MSKPESDTMDTMDTINTSNVSNITAIPPPQSTSPHTANQHKNDQHKNECDIYPKPQTVDDNTDDTIMPHVESYKSLSSMESVSSSYPLTHNNDVDGEIYENTIAYSTHAIDIDDRLDTHITPSPKNRQSPLPSASHTHTNNIISALSRLHSNNIDQNHRQLSPSPRDNDNDNDSDDRQLCHQDLKISSAKPLKYNRSITTVLWDKYQQMMSNGDNSVLSDNENDINEPQNSGIDEKQSENGLGEIINSDRFISGAFTMYETLDSALTDINALKRKQLRQMQTFTNNRKQQLRMRHSDSNESKECKNDDMIDINAQVTDVMKTLVSSTTQMGSFFNENTNESQSMIGGLLDRLSSSIAYMSYLSVTALTPFIYNMVEAVLIELYATIKDVIEYYDSDPKNNILWRIIDKMNEIIEAIRGLMALSDCFYEISSDIDNSDNDNDCNDEPSEGYSFFQKKKEKKD